MKSVYQLPESPGAQLDQFDLRIDLTDPHTPYADSLPNYLITQAIFINGTRLAPENTISLMQLAKSCQLAGEFFIVTCDCGEASCAGIDDGILVAHFNDRIEWQVPDPLSYRGKSNEEAEEMDQHRVYKRFSFQPEAYLSAIQDGLRIAKGLLFGEKQPVECSPYGFTPEQLLLLDPIVFSERGATVGCQIVASNIALDGSVDWLTINGISYRLREFPVPDEIKALDCWSDWEPKPCGPDGLVFGALAAPASELRRRIRLLAVYLASVTLKGGKVQASYQGWQFRDTRTFDRQIVFWGNASIKSSKIEENN